MNHRAELDRLAGRWQAFRELADVDVAFNGRLRSTLGRAFLGRGRIELNPRIASDPALLLEVFVHEAAHLVAHERHGTAIRPHGPEWQALMRAAGYRPRARYRAMGMDDPVAPRKARFLHTCRDCGRERLARTTNRRWRCAPCADAGRGGRLTVTRLP